ncbi:MAG: LCP family protein [Candidatus Sericytochromatia bacterium]|nr:LCP family protein [Candidatus Sericytochromatia bacterium]
MAVEDPIRRRRRRRRRQPGRGAALVALALAALTGMVAGATMNHLLGQAAPAPRAVAPLSPPPDEVAPIERRMTQLAEPLHVLFLASDVTWEQRHGLRTQGLRGNTDTMLLARFDPARQDVRAISIPRDTRVPIEGHGTFKINAANPYGGPVLAAQTVADLLGVQIDRYVLVNTRAVIQLVDALGGIDLDLPQNYRYDDFTGKLHIRLNKGPNHLDGRMAHDFLRFRHDGRGDIGRIQRQQMFLQAAWAQWLTARNLLLLPELVGLVRENLETDLSMGEIIRVANWVRDLNQRHVRMVMVPGREAIVAGGWYWLPDLPATRRLAQAFLVNGVSTPLASPRDLRVALRDGVGDRQAITRLERALSQAGYGHIQYAGREPQLGHVTTQVIAQNGDEGSADHLARVIAARDIRVEATGIMGFDMTVVMGRDWAARLH